MPLPKPQPLATESWIMLTVLAISVGIILGHWASIKPLQELASQPALTTTSLQQTTNQHSQPIGGLDWQVTDTTFQTILNYSTPAGPETNPVSLEIENGLITDFAMEIETPNQTSINYQERFIEEITPDIIGQPIASLRDLDTVAGASLTTDAFVEAISNLE